MMYKYFIILRLIRNKYMVYMYWPRRHFASLTGEYFTYISINIAGSLVRCLRIQQSNQIHCKLHESTLHLKAKGKAWVQCSCALDQLRCCHVSSFVQFLYTSTSQRIQRSCALDPSRVLKQKLHQRNTFFFFPQNNFI